MKIAYLNNIRFTAILMVVFIHSWDEFTISARMNNDLGGWVLFQTMHIIGRLGVPLFAMLTGALLLSRVYEDIPNFLIRRLPRFYGTLIISAIVFLVLSRVLFGTSTNGFIQSLLNGNPIGSIHLWYIYMIIGLYLTIPFLSRMVHNLNRGELRLLIIISIITFTIPWTLNIADLRFKYTISSGFTFSTYAIYALVGHYLVKFDGLTGVSRRIRAIAFVIVLGVTVLIKTVLDFEPGIKVPTDGVVWYDSILIMAPSVLLFTIIRDYSAQLSRSPTVVDVIAKSTFSIYIWHVVALYMSDYYLSDKLSLVLLIAISVLTGLLFGVALHYIFRNTKLSFLV